MKMNFAKSSSDLPPDLPRTSLPPNLRTARGKAKAKLAFEFIRRTKCSSGTCRASKIAVRQVPERQVANFDSMFR